MSILALVFFFVFVAVLFGAYLGIRRQRGNPALIAALTVLGAVLSMVAFSLAQGNVFAHALLVGIPLGLGFSIATLAIAFYFQGNERRSAARKRTE